MHTVLWKRAIIESVPVESNPTALHDIETALRSRGIIAADERLIEYRELQDFVRAGGESYGARFRIRAMDRSGQVADRDIYAKAIVTGFGTEGTSKTVAEQVRRLRLLRTWGIRTPRVYGSGPGTIYEEFINGRPFAVEGWWDWEELAGVAATLDFRGARPINFLSDLMVGPGPHFFYVDTGCDLGHIVDGMPPAADAPSRRALLDAFPERLRPSLDKAYRMAYDRLSSSFARR
jgi:hypothetical protein